MKVGDLVRVRLKPSPHILSVGILVREPRKMYMAGNIAEVMIDGVIRYVKQEHIVTIYKREI